MESMAVYTHKSKYWTKTEPPDDARRCLVCGILIFDSEAEAVAGRVPYFITVNHAVGELCVGCAGGDESEERLLTLVQRIERGGRVEREEIVMSQDNGLFLEMETGVMPPAAGPSGAGQSKYAPFEKIILELSMGRKGVSEWARFKFADPKSATNASAWLMKRGKAVYREQGHDVSRRVVKNEDGTAWLYVQRFKLEEGDKS
jgi:hypothetical protein